MNAHHLKYVDGREGTICYGNQVIVEVWCIGEAMESRYIHPWSCASVAPSLNTIVLLYLHKHDAADLDFSMFRPCLESYLEGCLRC